MNLSIIKQFVRGFYVNNHGGSCKLDMQVPGPTMYNAVLELLGTVLGESAAKVFSSAVDATDDAFYLNFSPTEDDLTDEQLEQQFEEFWQLLLSKATVTTDEELLLTIGGFNREKDNNGQIVLYTELMEKDGKIVPFVEE